MVKVSSYSYSYEINPYWPRRRQSHNELARRLRRKTGEQEDEKIGIDRISELPESLISNILSFLDMKHAVKTCVLSTKWKYSWTHVDNMVFEFGGFIHDNEEELKAFMSFVDRTLMQCTCLKINTFSLEGWFQVTSNVDPRKSTLHMGELLDKWLEFVLGRNVQFINLGFRGLDYAIPIRLYQSSSLERLKILGEGNKKYNSPVSLEVRDGNFYYRKTFDVRWNVLKSLYLSSVFLVEEFLAEILSGSPMLKTIGLENVRGLSKLNITSPSVSEVKLLNMSGGHAKHAVHLDIIAPWVKKLEVCGVFYSFDCNVVSVTSLEKAELVYGYASLKHVDMHDEDYMLVIMIDKLLKPVCHVNELVIGAELLQALSLNQLTNKPSMEFKCKDLNIYSSFCEHDIPGITCLLESSPNLENLVIGVFFKCYIFSYKKNDYKYIKYLEEVFGFFNGVDYLNKHRKKFPCLKNVKIDCSKRWYSCRQDRMLDYMYREFEIAAYIIKHAPLLEKLVVVCSEYNFSRCQARYFSLLSSEHKVGKKAIQWELKKMGYTCEYRFSR